MKFFLISLWFLSVVVSAGEVSIAVSTNAGHVMGELKTEFIKENPDIDVKITLASSGILLKHIRKGSDYGVFMSANMDYPQALYDDKIAITKPLVYAQGALAFFSTTPQDFFKGMDLLKTDAIKHVAIADPKTAPYGKAAIEALKDAGIYKEIKHKIIYAKNIGQAFTYTVMAAEIGIVSKSSLFSPKMKRYQEGIGWTTVNPGLYAPIRQGIVLLENAKDNNEYKTFYNFVLSNKAKRIFQKYGYIY